MRKSNFRKKLNISLSYVDLISLQNFESRIVSVMNIKVIFLFTLAVSSSSASIFGPSSLIKGIGKRVSLGYLIFLWTSLKSEYIVVNTTFFCARFSLICILYNNFQKKIQITASTTFAKSTSWISGTRTFDGAEWRCHPVNFR